MALIALVLLATGTLAFSLATMSAAAAYADMSYRRELRIQARLNADACLDSVSLMAAKDYFLNGHVKLSEFGCDAQVANDLKGNLNIRVNANSNRVSFQDSRSISI